MQTGFFRVEDADAIDGRPGTGVSSQKGRGMSTATGLSMTTAGIPAGLDTDETDAITKDAMMGMGVGGRGLSVAAYGSASTASAATMVNSPRSRSFMLGSGKTPWSGGGSGAGGGSGGQELEELGEMADAVLHRPIHHDLVRASSVGVVPRASEDTIRGIWDVKVEQEVHVEVE